MTTLELALNDERLAPFLPLVASVWEDGQLTELEIAAVCMPIASVCPGSGRTSAIRQ